MILGHEFDIVIISMLLRYSKLMKEGEVLIGQVLICSSRSDRLVSIMEQSYANGTWCSQATLN